MAATKIVIVAGQEFSVPAETDNEAVRQQLAGMGFADVAAATIQKGKKAIDGVEYETVEFVKKAGTKGLDGAELAALLAGVPRAAPPAQAKLGRDERVLVQRLAAGTLTIGEALAHRAVLLEALERSVRPGRLQSEGEALCAPCDVLPAVAAPAPSAW